MKRYLSRKFILALAGQLAGLAILIWPHHEAGIAAMSEAIAGLLVTVLSTLGYLTAEASIDRTRAKAELSDGSS